MKDIEILKERINEAFKNTTTDFQLMRAFRRLRGTDYQLNLILENVSIEGVISPSIESNPFFADFDVQISFSLDDKDLSYKVAQIDRGDSVNLIVEFEDYGIMENGVRIHLDLKDVID